MALPKAASQLMHHAPISCNRPRMASCPFMANHGHGQPMAHAARFGMRSIWRCGDPRLSLVTPSTAYLTLKARTRNLDGKLTKHEALNPTTRPKPSTLGRVLAQATEAQTFKPTLTVRLPLTFGVEGYAYGCYAGGYVAALWSRG